MNHTWLFVLISVAGLCACERGSQPAIVETPGKVDGPNVKTLSHDQLMDAYHDCTQYGAIDDPKVKYTVRYCAAVQSAHLSEGYTAPGTAKVDPTLNKMH
jgi:hypothetical protein